MIGLGPGNSTARAVGLELRAWRPSVEYLADRDTAGGEFFARSLDVGNNQVEAAGRAGRSRRDVGAELDRAPRAGRRELDDPETVIEREVGVEPPPEVPIEFLRAVGVWTGMTTTSSFKSTFARLPSLASLLRTSSFRLAMLFSPMRSLGTRGSNRNSGNGSSSQAFENRFSDARNWQRRIASKKYRKLRLNEKVILFSRLARPAPHFAARLFFAPKDASICLEYSAAFARIAGSSRVSMRLSSITTLPPMTVVLTSEDLRA